VPGYNLHDVVLRAAGVPSRVAGAADGVLLGWFVAERDAAAFAELVRRHGSMVLGIARRELGNGPDADDACQAVFLVLARKAANVRRGDAVGAWLYGVARRVSRKVGAATARRRGRETPLAELPGPDTTAAISWRDALHVLDEELGRPPDSYRAPLVLCYLEGRTQDEAARQLGWSLGAFRGRLERGRARLRDRLTRRGVRLAVLAAAAVARPGQVAAGMQLTIINTATAVAAGEALAVPVSVAALAEGAIRAMSVTKLQWAVGVIAVSGMLTIGGVWATGQGPGVGGQPPGAAPAQPTVACQAKDEAPVERTASASQRQKSLNNLKLIMFAIHNYHDANHTLPADIRDKDGKAVLSWRVAILPYLAQDTVARGFAMNEPWDSETNLKMLQQIPEVYRVGFEPKGGTHTYCQAFAGPGTPLHPTVLSPNGQHRAIPKPGGGVSGREVGPEVHIPRDFVDGTQNTLGVVQAGLPVPWTKPADIPFDPQKPVKPVTPFSNEWHVTTMDGAVYALNRDIDPEILRRLIIINDGEQTPSLDTFRPPLLPAETEAEKRDLRTKIDENQQKINHLRELTKELDELLTLRNRLINDLTDAERFGKYLESRIEILKLWTKATRDDTGLRPGDPVPKPTGP
jgi:RNA polymerase sigma factor (sigma-70 family)